MSTPICRHGLVLCLECHDRAYLLRVIEAQERRRGQDEPPWMADLRRRIRDLAIGGAR